MKRHLVMILLSLAAIALSSRAQTVHVEGGTISGAESAVPSVRVYRGIPFAAPPVGDLRWRAPQPVVPWNEVRAADRYSSACMQIPNVKGATHYAGEEQYSEDCLYLNVWSPAKSARESLPVMVWIYGGGFSRGSASSPFISGEHLAAQGVVVVNFNYRTGILGFLAHPDLTKESDHHTSGDYGLMDQVAALSWVQKNIAAFGGDPKRVTLFGQSAGSASVCYMMASPLTKGLFIHAIGESIGCFGSSPNLAKAEQQGTKYMAAAKVASIAELRAKPAEELPLDDRSFRPIVDGYVETGEPYAVFQKGQQDQVPVIVGSNGDEGTLIGAPPKSAEVFIQMAHRQYGDRADAFLRLFPAGSDAEAKDSYYTMVRDQVAFQMRTWSRLVAADGKLKAYRYYFSHKPPVPDGTYIEQAVRPLGAYHTAEIEYVFRNLNARPYNWTDEDRKLSNIISSYWVNFAKTGDPNAASLPKWPSCDADRDVLMEFGAGSSVEAHRGFDNAALDFFEANLKRGSSAD